MKLVTYISVNDMHCQLPYISVNDTHVKEKMWTFLSLDVCGLLFLDWLTVQKCFKTCKQLLQKLANFILSILFLCNVKATLRAGNIALKALLVIDSNANLREKNESTFRNLKFLRNFPLSFALVNKKIIYKFHVQL